MGVGLLCCFPWRYALHNGGSQLAKALFDKPKKPPLPEKVEVMYGKYASELSRHSIRNIENIYLGRSRSGNDGQGLDDYLAFINANYNGGSLNDVIKSRLTEVRMALDAIPNDLGYAVVNNPTPVNDAYLKMVQALVLLKTDMPSALGILITYQDNDGD